MLDVERIIEQLCHARAELESAANGVPAELWRKPPRPGAWSAAEVIAHLTMVEGLSPRVLQSGCARPPTVPFWKRLHLPIWLAEWRGIRFKTPIPLDPKLLDEKEAMLGRLAGLRRRALALLEETRGPELSGYRWKHPFFGSLNYYSWFRVVAHHETRHTQQIREIVKCFQK